MVEEGEVVLLRPKLSGHLAALNVLQQGEPAPPRGCGGACHEAYDETCIWRLGGGSGGSGGGGGVLQSSQKQGRGAHSPDPLQNGWS